MGQFSYKGGSSTYRKFSENYDNIEKNYNVENGYIGNKGKSSKSRNREIEADDPIKASQELYDTLSYGGIETKLPKNKGDKTTMKDGTVIVRREITSTPNSPAVEINITKSTEKGKLKSQKIHFTKKGNKK